MRIEALCTGDELLTGMTTDTNTTYFAGQVLALGEQLSQVQVVGDVREEIIAALKSASGRADAVLVSGGLGPTSDDLTAECAAKMAGVALVENAAALEHLKARFAERKLVLSANNLKQALVPEGAEVVVSPVGSAPMFVLQLGRCTAFFVAGVPREYKYLVTHEVIPRLSKMRERLGAPSFRAMRLLKTVGLAESHLDAKTTPLFAAHPHVNFGYRTQAPENHLRLIAVGASQAEADERLAAAEKATREVLGESVFGADAETLAERVGQLLREREATLALAESCTGGGIGALITRVPGSSAYFLGAAVVYANALKERWAQVPAELIQKFGAVSAPVAEQMAQGVRKETGATYGLSVTGIAGPTGGTEEKPVGTVYCGLAGPEGVSHRLFNFRGERDMVQAFAAHAALDLLRRTLRGHRS
jgi:nicotinamide-nucleotide amidase